MKRILVAPVAGLLTWLTLASAPASAQFTYPFRPPQYGYGYQTQLSPYLQMLRPGDPAVNFYAGVVPEVQRRQDRNSIYGSIQGLAMQLPAPPGINEEDFDAPLFSTGHPTAFNYTGMYFNSNSSMMGQANVGAFAQRRGGAGQRPGQGQGQGGGGWPNMNQQMGMGMGMPGR